MAYVGNFQVRASDSPSIDAFGRWRVAEPHTLFDSKLIIDAAPLRWDDVEASGSGTSSTYNTNQASVSLNVSNLAAGKRVRQSKRRFPYQAGKSQLCMFTSVFGAAPTGITKRLGYGDDNNGLFFQQTSTGVAVLRRTFTSGVVANNIVAQASWNMDPMNGTGPSGVNLDFTKTQIFLIDFEWLGVGRVRMGFVVGGIIIYCHEFLNANNLSVVYMSHPNLPCRYSIENDGTGPAASLTQICCAIQSEAGQENIGFTFGLNRGDTPLTTLNDNAIYPLIALRYQTGRNIIPIEMQTFTVACSTATTVFAAYLILNPTVAGTAFSFTPLANSALEYDISRTNGTKVSAGTILDSTVGVTTKSSAIAQLQTASDIGLGSTVVGVSDIMVLGVQRLTGATEPFYGSIAWREMR